MTENDMGAIVGVVLLLIMTFCGVLVVSIAGLGRLLGKRVKLPSGSIPKKIARKYVANLIMKQLAKAHWEVRGEPYRDAPRRVLAVDTWDALPPNLAGVLKDAPASYKDAVAEEMLELAEQLMKG